LTAAFARDGGFARVPAAELSKFCSRPGTEPIEQHWSLPARSAARCERSDDQVERLVRARSAEAVAAQRLAEGVVPPGWFGGRPILGILSARCASAID
jgi:hypothetical protein